MFKEDKSQTLDLHHAVCWGLSFRRLLPGATDGPTARWAELAGGGSHGLVSAEIGGAPGRLDWMRLVDLRGGFMVSFRPFVRFGYLSCLSTLVERSNDWGWVWLILSRWQTIVTARPSSAHVLAGPEEREGLPALRVDCEEGHAEIIGVEDIDGLASLWPNQGAGKTKGNHNNMA